MICGLINNISRLATAGDEDSEADDEEGQFDRELTHIGKYKADRFRKIEKAIKDKMTAHKDDLKKKWEEKRDILDHKALKEMRNDFESTHKQMNFMVSEWDKSRLSNILNDYVADLVAEKFEEYVKD